MCGCRKMTKPNASIPSGLPFVSTFSFTGAHGHLLLLLPPSHVPGRLAQEVPFSNRPRRKNKSKPTVTLFRGTPSARSYKKGRRGSRLRQNSDSVQTSQKVSVFHQITMSMRSSPCHTFQGCLPTTTDIAPSFSASIRSPRKD